jgi:hypothetical protein
MTGLDLPRGYEPPVGPFDDGVKSAPACSSAGTAPST